MFQARLEPSLATEATKCLGLQGQAAQDAAEALSKGAVILGIIRGSNARNLATKVTTCRDDVVFLELISVLTFGRVRSALSMALVFVSICWLPLFIYEYGIVNTDDQSVLSTWVTCYVMCFRRLPLLILRHVGLERGDRFHILRSVFW